MQDGIGAAWNEWGRSCDFVRATCISRITEAFTFSSLAQDIAMGKYASTYPFVHRSMGSNLFPSSSFGIGPVAIASSIRKMDCSVPFSGLISAILASHINHQHYASCHSRFHSMLAASFHESAQLSPDLMGVVSHLPRDKAVFRREQGDLQKPRPNSGSTNDLMNPMIVITILGLQTHISRLEGT